MIPGESVERIRATGRDRRQERRLCSWCGGPIPAGARSDSKFCKTPCRQASHRFRRDATGAGDTRHLAVAHGHDRPRRFAYADPPYPGLSARYYSDHQDFAGEVDQTRLIADLTDGYPDGWALSTSSRALPQLLASCPPGARVAAWFRGERAAAGERPLQGWEPVIFWGGASVAVLPRSTTG